MIYKALKTVIVLASVACVFIVSVEAKAYDEAITLSVILALMGFALHTLVSKIEQFLTKDDGQDVQYSAHPVGIPSHALPVARQGLPSPKDTPQQNVAHLPIGAIEDEAIKLKQIVMKAWQSAFVEMGDDAKARIRPFQSSSVGVSGIVTIMGKAEEFTGKRMKTLRNKITHEMRRHGMGDNKLSVEIDGIDVYISVPNTKMAYPDTSFILDNTKGIDEVCIGIGIDDEPVILNTLKNLSSNVAILANTGGGKSVTATSLLYAVLSGFKPTEAGLSLAYMKPENWEVVNGRAGDFNIWQSVPHVINSTSEADKIADIIIEAWESRNDNGLQYHFILLDDWKDIVTALKGIGSKGKKALETAETIARSGRTSGIRLIITSQQWNSAADAGGGGLFTTASPRIVGTMPDSSSWINGTGKILGKHHYAMLSGKYGDAFLVKNQNEYARVLTPKIDDEEITRRLITPHISPLSPEPASIIEEDGFSDDDWGDVLDPEPDQGDILDAACRILSDSESAHSGDSGADDVPRFTGTHGRDGATGSPSHPDGGPDGLPDPHLESVHVGENEHTNTHQGATPPLKGPFQAKNSLIGGGGGPKHAQNDENEHDFEENEHVFDDNELVSDQNEHAFNGDFEHDSYEIEQLFKGCLIKRRGDMSKMQTSALRVLYKKHGWTINKLVNAVWSSRTPKRTAMIKYIVSE